MDGSGGNYFNQLHFLHEIRLRDLTPCPDKSDALIFFLFHPKEMRIDVQDGPHETAIMRLL